MTTNPSGRNGPRLVSGEPERVPRRAFAEHPGDPTRTATRYMLRLAPNGAEPLADTVAALDRLLLVFTIGADAGTEITPERIARYVVESLGLSGRVHVLLEPVPMGSDPAETEDEPR
jgi:hypothetical protein